MVRSVVNSIFTGSVVSPSRTPAAAALRAETVALAAVGQETPRPKRKAAAAAGSEAKTVKMTDNTESQPLIREITRPAAAGRGKNVEKEKVVKDVFQRGRRK